MSTIIVAAVLILVIISICLILISLNNRIGKKQLPSFLLTSERWGQKIIYHSQARKFYRTVSLGWTENKRKLLILKKNDEDKYDSHVLDLNDMKSCSKKKIYRSVNIGTEKKEKFENQIDKIALAFHFIDNREPIHISFFDPVTNHIFAMQELEQKAKNWETILTKLLNTGLKKIA
jgi:hypothetical protein